eukprot:6821664-Heterocapsa_arctica.AAC.1
MVAAQTAASATASRFFEARLIRESMKSLERPSSVETCTGSVCFAMGLKTGGPSMRPMIGKPRM